MGAGVISDLFAPYKRGTAMGIFTFGPLLGKPYVTDEVLATGDFFLTTRSKSGPAIGPLIGGFVVVHLGWRWEFWTVLIAGGTLSLLYHFF